MQRKYLVAFGLAFALLLAVGATGAFAAQPEPVLPDADTTNLFTSAQSAEVFENIIQALKDAVPISPAVLLLVQFVLKPLSIAAPWPWLNQRKAPELAAFVAIAFVIVGALSNTSVYSDTFDSTASLLDNIAPPLMTVLASVSFAAGGFNLLQWLGLDNSILANSRTPKGEQPALVGPAIPA